MKAVAVIPARWASRRFPGKPLFPIAGRPMLQRVVEGARRAKRLARVVVATDDERIARACEGFGTQAIRTSSAHATGTDRLAEAAEGLSEEIVVNVQGDEPLIEGFVIDAVVDALQESPEADMATVAHTLPDDAALDPHVVKVVLDRGGFALYFSRAAIPALGAAGASSRRLQHVGLYAYRRPFLQRFARLSQTPLERAEGLEQLRALEHGYRVRCAVIDGWRGVSVDVPGDVAKVEARLRELGR